MERRELLCLEAYALTYKERAEAIRKNISDEALVSSLTMMSMPRYDIFKASVYRQLKKEHEAELKELEDSGLNKDSRVHASDYISRLRGRKLTRAEWDKLREAWSKYNRIKNRGYVKLTADALEAEKFDDSWFEEALK